MAVTSSDDLAPEVATWLVGSEGIALVSAATARLDAGNDELAVAGYLRETTGSEHDRGARAAAVLTAAVARRRARRRWGEHAERLLFTRTSLEQASDPSISRWRAGRFDPLDVHDLCAGVGGDALALAATGARVTAVDHDRARLMLLRHNAGVFGVDVATREADALAHEVPTSAFVHADPSRRQGERRVHALASYVPPVDALAAHVAGCQGSAIVVAPGVDEHDPAMPGDVEVEYLQLGDELAEGVLWRGALRHGDATATATLLPSGRTRTRRGPRPVRLRTGPMGDVLLEVAPAAVRARLHDDIGGELGARRVAHRRALLTIDGLPPASPWYRPHRVLAVLAPRPKAVRRWLRSPAGAEHRDDPVEVALHGVDTDAAAWRRALAAPRGPQGLKMHLIRGDEGSFAVVAVPVVPPS